MGEHDGAADAGVVWRSDLLEVMYAEAGGLSGGFPPGGGGGPAHHWKPAVVGQDQVGAVQAEPARVRVSALT